MPPLVRLQLIPLLPFTLLVLLIPALDVVVTPIRTLRYTHTHGLRPDTFPPLLILLVELIVTLPVTDLPVTLGYVTRYAGRCRHWTPTLFDLICCSTPRLPVYHCRLPRIAYTFVVTAP